LGFCDLGLTDGKIDEFWDLRIRIDGWKDWRIWDWRMKRWKDLRFSILRFRIDGWKDWRIWDWRMKRWKDLGLTDGKIEGFGI
jgi:hypothetical protein